MSNLLPDAGLASIKNAARMAVFADASYLDEEDEHASQRGKFAERFIEGKTVWWCHDHASGVVYVDEKRVCIGIAGARLQDVVDRLGVVPQEVREWSELTGIPVPSDAQQATSAAGFLTHTTSCYMGIERALYEHFCLTLAELSKPMWIAGHHLGGASAQLLQCTTLFSHARSFAYGSPRVFSKDTKVPARLRVCVRRLTDPMSYLPPAFRHASAETLYVKHPGVVSRGMPWLGWPITVFCAANVWAEGTKRRSDRGHSMARYLTDLRSLR